jgi:hypothetical protein
MLDVASEAVMTNRESCIFCVGFGRRKAKNYRFDTF